MPKLAASFGDMNNNNDPVDGGPGPNSDIPCHLMTNEKEMCQANECRWSDTSGDCRDAYDPCHSNYESTACENAECSWRGDGGWCVEFDCRYAENIESCHNSLYGNNCYFRHQSVAAKDALGRLGFQGSGIMMAKQCHIVSISIVL